MTSTDVVTLITKHLDDQERLRVEWNDAQAATIDAENQLATLRRAERDAKNRYQQAASVFVDLARHHPEAEAIKADWMQRQSQPVAPAAATPAPRSSTRPARTKLQEPAS